MKLLQTTLISGFLLILAACGGGDGPRMLKEGETLRVMASTPHLASLAMAIAGDKASVETLAPEGVSSHDYEPTMQDRRRIEAAHLLLINGLGLEPFDATRVAGDARITLVDCSTKLDGAWLISAVEEEEHDHDHDHDHHDHGEYNPHVWMSVTGSVAQAEAIADAMATSDSANAELYRKNLEALVRRIKDVGETYRPRCAKLAKKTFVSNHDAFPYFAREFGLTQVGVIQRTPGHEPTIDERRKIELLLAKGEAHAIFMEPGYDDAASKTIAESSGLPLAVLDPFDIGKAAPDAMENALRKNLETVLKTLGE